MKETKPEADPLLADVQVMGIYAGLSPRDAAAKLLTEQDGNRARAHQIANRRAYSHPETVVRKWWEQVAIAIEGWKDKLPTKAAAGASGNDTPPADA